ncbi:MAG: cation:proton antiporter [Thermoanaerobaculia bacterium]
MSTFDLTAILLVVAGILAYLNLRYFRLPSTIAMLVAGLLGAIVFLIADYLIPSLGIGARVQHLLADMNFSGLLMNGMLGFLLFAGSLTVDFQELKRNLSPVLTLATIGTLISTAVVGVASYFLFPIARVSVPFLYCLVFGALISPTDPVAVLALMEDLKVPKSLQIFFTGESLLNDGVGVVVFTVLLAVASATGGGISALGVAGLFAQEVIGGCVLGLAGGLVLYQAMKQIDEPNIEVQLSVALVTAIVASASHLHVSGPLACVVAGIYIGNHARESAMRDATSEALDRIWSFADYLMNAILFLLLGLQAAGFQFGSAVHALMIGAVIALVIVARLVSVAVPLTLLRRTRNFPTGMIRMLTWGGLRGGISVALALSLPLFQGRAAVLNATYGVVIFTIVVQGLTIGKFVRRFQREDK